MEEKDDMEHKDLEDLDGEGLNEPDMDEEDFDGEDQDGEDIDQEMDGDGENISSNKGGSIDDEFHDFCNEICCKNGCQCNHQSAANMVLTDFCLLNTYTCFLNNIWLNNDYL